MMAVWSVLLMSCIASTAANWAGSRRIRDLMGGGNLPSGKDITANGKYEREVDRLEYLQWHLKTLNLAGMAEYQVLEQIQAHNGRLNLYPGDYVNGSCPKCWDHPHTDVRSS